MGAVTHDCKEAQGMLRSLANPTLAASAARFFKTGRLGKAFGLDRFRFPAWTSRGRLRLRNAGRTRRVGRRFGTR